MALELVAPTLRASDAKPISQSNTLDPPNDLLLAAFRRLARRAVRPAVLRLVTPHSNLQAASAAFEILVVRPFQSFDRCSASVVLLLVVHIFNHPFQILSSETYNAVTVLPVE